MSALGGRHVVLMCKSAATSPIFERPNEWRSLGALCSTLNFLCGAYVQK
jgi:hypothetical protein